MKILFVISEYYPDGAGSGRSVRNLAESLVKRDYEVVVVRLNKDKQSTVTNQNGVKIYSRPIRNLYWVTDKIKNPILKALWHLIDIHNIFAMHDLKRILQIEKPDIVNTSVIAGSSAGIYKTIKRSKAKLIHTLRDYYLLCPKSSMFKDGHSCTEICAGCKPFAATRKHQSRAIDMVLANSNYVLRAHKTHGIVRAGRTPFAVQFNMNDNDTIYMCRSLDFNNTVRIGFIGRIDKVKGLESLLESTWHLNAKNWHLKIAGTGDPATIKNLQAKYSDERIEYLGHTDAEAFYTDIDILICPSLYAEPLPRVVYEAYRHALPVIAANTGGIPEIVEHGKTGYLYDPHDIKALSGFIDTLVQDPELYKKMSKAAARKAKDFTRTAITDQFEGHLKTLMGEAL